MKKFILLFFVSTFLFFFGQAQNNFPLPSDNPFWTESHGMLWSCSYQGTYGICNGYYCECVMPTYYKSDTLINGVTYNRLYTRGVCNAIYPAGSPPSGCPSSFNYHEPERLLATIRQDTATNIVYVRDMGTDKILYDFNNIHVGQDYPKTYNNNSSDTLVVVSMDTIPIGNSYSRKWDLGIKVNGVISDSGFVSIIEGIGSTFGITAELTMPFENKDLLLCYSKDDVALYPDSTYNCDKTIDIVEFVKEDQELIIYPNPTTKNLTIKINGEIPVKGFVRIFNANGMEVYRSAINEKEVLIDVSFLNKGVYFVQYFNEFKWASKLFVKE
ncbi:MAG: T9SS type A sorting domain-containing protein [Bacteroidales bacterium]|nr:T9SS type A sorting domain-containing protein [Bacteroidales bacterium]